ncbi:MAG: porphobilinogen synthase [Treponema sp.]|nr:porphobilinogen synthase [Treponema sp.]
MAEMYYRARRLRGSDTLRRMVRETRLSQDALIYPVFVKAGNNIQEPIPAMEGQYRYSVDRLGFLYDQLLERGLRKVLFFGLPEQKDPHGSGAYQAEGIIQSALQYTAAQYPEIFRITDVCMCAYTSHGHCGILEGDQVDNDKTLPYLAKIALSHAEAGAQMLAPSDMMDGRVGVIRRALDSKGYPALPILSYAVKYSSSFYGPFRAAADSTPAFGDRKTYQMDYHNQKEGIRTALKDIEEGADMVMVKPALAYLDVIQRVADRVMVPVAAYSVSGEYAMIKAAAQAGYMDEAQMVCESAVSIFRAGAQILISYFAREIAQWIAQGRIG